MGEPEPQDPTCLHYTLNLHPLLFQNQPKIPLRSVSTTEDAEVKKGYFQASVSFPIWCEPVEPGLCERVWHNPELGYLVPGHSPGQKQTLHLGEGGSPQERSSNLCLEVTPLVLPCLHPHRGQVSLGTGLLGEAVPHTEESGTYLSPLEALSSVPSGKNCVAQVCEHIKSPRDLPEVEAWRTLPTPSSHAVVVGYESFPLSCGLWKFLLDSSGQIVAEQSQGDTCGGPGTCQDLVTA